MQEQLELLLKEAEQEIAQCSGANDILNTKAKYLGKKSLLNGLYGKMRELDPADRPAFGNQLNVIRQEIETAINARAKAIKEIGRASCRERV